MSATPLPLSRKERRLHRHGAELHFRDEGAGPALVFLHGWALSLSVWEPQARHFVDGYRVVRLDRRGAGASSGPASLADEAADLVALLDHLDIRTATLVGMSQGARVTLEAAFEAHERIDALVLDGTPPDPQFVAGEWPTDIPRERYRKILAESGIAAVRREIAASGLFASHSIDPRVQDTVARLLDGYSGLDLIEPGARIPVTTPERVRSLAMPVLIVNGEHDPRRAFGDALCASIRGAQRAIIGASGHLPSLDNPQDYNAALQRFFAGVQLNSPRSPAP
jgi:pimeloyl-ACP methyl ester carboxylesterase